MPSITISRAKGQPVFNPATDFAMCIIGTSSTTPVATGALSTPYGDPNLTITDYGLGDGVDAVGHALTNGAGDNPQPGAVVFVSTNGTSSLTAGARGATLTSTLGNGTPTVVSKTASTHPVGTFEPFVKVKDDGNNGAGTLVGSSGIVLSPSLDGGRTFLPDAALGTAVTFKIQISINGVLTDTGVQFDFTNGAGQKLQTGDHWIETKTTPPQWAVADLYTAGNPATGILMNIANSGLNFGLIVITEPAAAGDIATLKAGLTQMTAIKASCRPTLIVRFRDQAVGESDATYTAALATFRAACADDERILCVAGDGWVTDALRAFVYSRSGLAPLLTRLQGMSVIAGRRGERVAQHPGWGQRGPIPGFTIRDTKGNPVGHDEKARPGGNQPVAGKGGFLTFYYEAHEDVAGTYVFGAPTLYGVGSSILTLMDNRLSSGIERALYSIAFDFLEGAEVVNTVGSTVTLDQDACDAMSGAAMKRIRDRYSTEFQNANDPNLVTVNSAVVVSGSTITVQWYVNDRLYLYVDGIIITIANARP